MPATKAKKEMGSADFTALSDAAKFMERALVESTGMPAADRKRVIYWTLGTHALPSLPSYPLLMLHGKYNTGKSTALDVISCFARKPQRMSLRGSTIATIRDFFHRTWEATAILEEADGAMHDQDSRFENLLSDRFNRKTGNAKVNRQAEAGRWEEHVLSYFGATAVHRRLAWKDPALESRSIKIRLKPDFKRSYAPFDSESPVPWVKLGMEQVQGLILTLPPVEPPKVNAGRIQAGDLPLLGIAKLLGDNDFPEQLQREAELAMEALRQGQQDEPDVLILAAVLAKLTDESQQLQTVETWGSISISSLRDWLWSNHHLALAPRQIALELRELGLEVRISHGYSKLFPQPQSLLLACEQAGYEDDALAQLQRWRPKSLLEMPAKNTSTENK
jgi:hypothetical protein